MLDDERRNFRATSAVEGKGVVIRALAIAATINILHRFLKRWVVGYFAGSGFEVALRGVRAGLERAA
jgi:hypothetical protein